MWFVDTVCGVIFCTIFIMDAGIRGTLTLKLVFWGLRVDDSCVSLLEHLLYQGICAHVILTIWSTVLLHCKTTNTQDYKKASLITLSFWYFFSIDSHCTCETLTFMYEKMSQHVTWLRCLLRVKALDHYMFSTQEWGEQCQVKNKSHSDSHNRMRKLISFKGQRRLYEHYSLCENWMGSLYSQCWVRLWLGLIIRWRISLCIAADRYRMWTDEHTLLSGEAWTSDCLANENLHVGANHILPLYHIYQVWWALTTT